MMFIVYRTVLVFLILLLPFLLYSQTDPENSELIQKNVERLTESSEEDTDLSDLTDSYLHLLEHPVNLNSADVSELTDCGLFNEFQVHSLLAHREKFGPLIAIPELQVIDGFSENYIREISSFITVGKHIDQPNASIGRMVKEGKHTVIIRGQRVPEGKRGFADEGNGPVYAGDPYGIMVKYRFNFMRKLSWGLTAEKDPGEQFFKGAQKHGFDFYSGHIAVRDVGLFRLITLGDFQLEYGQGLTLMTSLSGGKGGDPTSVRKSFSGIRPYTSTNESAFKRGVAVSLGKGSWRCDGFFSHRKLDANISAATDSLNSDEFFTSFQQSGFHRSESEIADRNAIDEILYGAHFKFIKRSFHVGFTGYETRYSHRLSKEVKPYNQYEFVGDYFAAAGCDYSLLLRNFNFFGETTMNMEGSIAMMHGFVLSADPRFALSVVFRNYPVTHQTLYSGAFRESGKNQNEKGIYVGFTFRPRRSWSISAHLDRFYFPWLRYRTDSPGGGHEINCQVSYLPSRKTELYLRFRTSEKNQNSSFENNITSFTVPVKQSGLRIHLSNKVSKTFTLRTRVEFVKFRKESDRSNGLMIFQDVQYHPMSSRWKLNMRFAIYDTDSYDSRIYAYENDVLYSFSIPAYYYKGSRIYFNVRYKVSRGFDIYARYSTSVYSDLTAIGSGWEEIQGRRKSEVKLQLRFEF